MIEHNELSEKEKLRMQSDLQTIEEHQEFRRVYRLKDEQNLTEEDAAYHTVDKTYDENLKLNDIWKNAKALNISDTRRESLRIRRTRDMDFELVNMERWGGDSPEMSKVKDVVREYDGLLHRTVRTPEERDALFAEAKEVCSRAVLLCEAYLAKGKSIFFWRRDRYRAVESAKFRFAQEQKTLTKLQNASEQVKNVMHGRDRLIDLMNLHAVFDRVEAEAQQERELENMPEMEAAKTKAEKARTNEEADWNVMISDQLQRMDVKKSENHKQLCDMCRAMALATGENTAWAANMYSKLAKSNEDCTDMELLEKIMSIETMFSVLDDFDITKLNFNNDNELLSNHYLENLRMCLLGANCFSFFEDYDELMGSSERTLLRYTRADFAKLKAKAGTLSMALSWFNEINTQKEAASGDPFGPGKDITALLEENTTRELKRVELAEKEKIKDYRKERKASIGGDILDFGVETGNVVKTKEMDVIRNDIHALQAYFFSAMPPIPLNANNMLDAAEEAKIRAESLDGACLTVNMLFSRLKSSIDACLDSEGGAGYAGNEELQRMLTSLRTQCDQDTKLFRQKVFEYRSFLAENPEEAYKVHSWQDALKYAHYTVFDSEKSDEYNLSHAGAASSDILVIQKKGSEDKYYFREDEKTEVEDNDLFVDHFIAKQKPALSPEKTQKLFEALRSLVNSNVDATKFRDFRATLKIIKEAAEDDMLEYATLFNKNEFSTPEYRELFAAANKQEKKEIGKALSKLNNALFQRTMATKGSLGPRIGNEKSLSDRNVATSRLAEMLGVGDMICDSRLAAIKKDGKTIVGNLMEDTKGQAIGDVEEDFPELTFSDKAIGQLFTLPIFDLLCGQVDRHYANFHVKYEPIIYGRAQITEIKGIDNDMAFGKLDYKMVSAGYNRIRPVTEDSLRGMPIKFLNAIMALERPLLEQLLGDILDKEALDFMEDRLNGLKADIAQLQGLAKDPKTGQYYYEGEDADDKIRQLKVFKNIRKEYRVTSTPDGKFEMKCVDGKMIRVASLNQATMFTFKNMPSDEEIDKKLDARRKTLALAAENNNNDNNAD